MVSREINKELKTEFRCEFVETTAINKFREHVENFLRLLKILRNTLAIERFEMPS